MSSSEKDSDLQKTLEYSINTENVKENTEKISKKFILTNKCKKILQNTLDNHFIDFDLEKFESINFFFYLEEVCWYLTDFHKEFKKMTFQEFIAIIREYKFFSKYINDKSLYDFFYYKSRIKVFKAILLSEDLKYILGIKSYHKCGVYSLPGGKLNVYENGYECMKRELDEEIGYKVDDNNKKNEITFVNLLNDKVTYFIIPNVKKDYKFQRNTRYEVKNVRWIDIQLLKNDIDCKKNLTNTNVYNSLNKLREIYRSVKYVLDDVIESKLSKAKIESLLK